FHGDNTYARICGNPTRINTRYRLERAMYDMTGAVNELSPDAPYRYDSKLHRARAARFISGALSRRSN
ncbi:MAG: hypothetical protein ACREHG_08445, partial [Candidatus Saccharimonadales bacterium]